MKATKFMMMMMEIMRSMMEEDAKTGLYTHTGAPSYMHMPIHPGTHE